MSVAEQFPKACPCCGTTYTWAAWTTLECLGTRTYSGTTLELRHCACGDTLAIEVGWAGQEREGGPGEHLCDPREEAEL